MTYSKPTSITEQEWREVNKGKYKQVLDYFDAAFEWSGNPETDTKKAKKIIGAALDRFFPLSQIVNFSFSDTKTEKRLGKIDLAAKVAIARICEEYQTIKLDSSDIAQIAGEKRQKVASLRQAKSSHTL